MSRRRRVWLAAATLGAVVAAIVAFGVFGVHTLFVDDEVSEAGPSFDSGAAPDPGPAPTTGNGSPSAAPPTTAPTAPTTPAVREAGRGRFVERSHPGTGTVVILTDGSQTFVRFEDDFATDNGPDLYVTVSVAGRDIEVGRLKGNLGAQNYELPPDVDPDAIEGVSVWCKRFDVTFTSASLA